MQRLKKSDLVLAVGWPGFSAPLRSSRFRVTTSGWAELETRVDSEVARTELRFTEEELLQIRTLIDRLRTVSQTTMTVTDLARRELVFRDGEVERSFEAYDGEVPSELRELWDYLHERVGRGRPS